MIRLQFIGHLGRNAVQREVNGKSVLSFSVAHTDRFRNQLGVLQERTTWVDCALWEKENVGPYLTQGTQVYVEGTPYVDAYMNNAGEPAASLKLRVANLRLLGGRRKQEQEQNEEDGVLVADQPADDLPF